MPALRTGAAFGPHFLFSAVLSTPVDRAVENWPNSQGGDSLQTANPQEVWQRCLDTIEPHLSAAPASRVWFQETKPVSMSESTLTLSVPNAFTRNWLEARYRPLLLHTLAAV